MCAHEGIWSGCVPEGSGSVHFYEGLGSLVHLCIHDKGE